MPKSNPSLAVFDHQIKGFNGLGLIWPAKQVPFLAMQLFANDSPILVNIASSASSNIVGANGHGPTIRDYFFGHRNEKILA